MEKTTRTESQITAELGPIDPKVSLLLRSNPIHQRFTSWHEENFLPVEQCPSEELRSRATNSTISQRAFIRRESIEKKMKLRKPKKDKKKKKKKKSKKSKDKKESETESTCEEEPVALTEAFIFNPHEFFETGQTGTRRRLKLAYLYDPKTKIPIWSLIKDMLGKDLTRFAVPVYVCEPLSMLQRAMEAWNFREIVFKAAQESDRFKRLAQIAAFMMVQYTATLGRNKKPFNPLLGETFEYELDGIRMLTEQVSHHPPISAFHVEGEDFVSWGHIKLKSKLQTTGLDVTTQGLDFFRFWLCIFLGFLDFCFGHFLGFLDFEIRVNVVFKFGNG